MQDELARLLRVNGVVWALLVDEGGQLIAVGSLRDDLAKETIATMLGAIRETGDLLDFGTCTEVLFSGSKTTVLALVGERGTLALGLDSARANVGLIRVQTKKIASAILE